MKANHRMYSLPYNGTNPEWFLQEAEKRKNNIDHVYCELPNEEMLSHHHRQSSRQTAEL